MQIHYKKLNSNIPDLKRHTEGAAAFDLCNSVEINSHSFPKLLCKIPTGVSIEIPSGYFGLIKSRSSFSDRLAVIESIIDSDYRGEVHLQLFCGLFIDDVIPQYTRIAQLVIVPCFMGELIQAEMLLPTERGDKGFGSTGS